MSREVGMTFSAPMAGAIWRDEKWQTRRLIKLPGECSCVAGGPGESWSFAIDDSGEIVTRKPRLRVGDVMVVREPWRTNASIDPMSPLAIIDTWPTATFEDWTKPPIGDGLAIWYESDGQTPSWAGRYRHAMHMPFAFARSRRVVTAVRVDRLGDISEADANAESFYRHDGNGRRTDSPLFPSAAREFSAYWTRLHGPGAWERDRRKWVFIYEFERRG